ncbi:MAG TPA: CDP-alcohol phosphatidyltransferase family protein [Micromonosporaceae bacterium]
MRRSGSLARDVLLVQVAKRRAGVAPVAGATTMVYPPGVGDAEAQPRRARLIGQRGYRSTDTAPVSPAVPLPPGGAPSGPITIPLLPGERTTARRVKFAVANACTLASLLLGVIAIFLCMRGEVRVGAACLVGCVTFDGLDGALARRFGVASPFGAQMDSLADMVAFGVAAPVVVYASLHASAPTAAVAAVCALVASCAAIRLARFNVSPKDGRFFTGVPTTMAAAVLSVATLIGLRLPGVVAVVAIGLLALAMVSSFPYAKLARIVKLPAWVWVLPAVGLLIDYRNTFAVLVGAYLVSGPLLWLRQRQSTGRLAA